MSTSPAWWRRQKGEGLGNQFLANIRETDAIVNVVRCFDDDNIVHVAGKVDPIADIETIGTELALADLTTVEKPSSATKSQERRQRRHQAGGPAGKIAPTSTKASRRAAWAWTTSSKR